MVMKLNVSDIGRLSKIQVSCKDVLAARNRLPFSGKTASLKSCTIFLVFCALPFQVPDFQQP